MAIIQINHTNSSFLEKVPVSGSNSFSCKPLLLTEAIPSNESHWFQWKQVPVIETIPFGGVRLCRNHFP